MSYLSGGKGVIVVGERYVQDGHGENVRESLKQVHCDYKNLLGEDDAEI